MTQSTPTRRRQVLGAIAAASAGVAVARVLPPATVERTSEAPAQPGRRGSRGYEATEHVRCYYRLARF